jgi:hypothetical protein
LKALFVSNESEEQGTISVPDVTEVSSNIGPVVDADTSKTGETQPDVVILPEPDSLVESPDLAEEMKELEGVVTTLEHHAAVVASIIGRNETISGSLAKAIKVSLSNVPRSVFNGYQPVASFEVFDAPVRKMSDTLATHGILVGGIEKLKGGFRPSLESSDGTAQEVDVKEVSASVPPVKNYESEANAGSQRKVPDTVNDVSAHTPIEPEIDTAAKRQGEEIHKRLQRLSETSCALEGYIEIIRSSAAQGKRIGADTVQVMRYDLQRRYPNFFKDLAPSLELHDTFLFISNELADEMGEKKKSVGSAALAALKKFWEWVKGIYEKIKALIKKVIGIVDIEEEKTVYLLSVAKAMPAPGQELKPVPKPPAGVTSKAAEKVQARLGHDKVVSPPKELPKTVKVAGTSILESYEDDLWGMGSYETGGLTHIYDYYTNMMYRAAQHLDKPIIRLSDALAFEEVVKDLAKFPTRAVFAGNKQFQYKEGTASLKLVDYAKSGSESYEEIDMLPISDIKDYLEKNKTLLGNIKWIGESWDKTLAMLDDLGKKTVNDPAAKAIITKYITEFLNSDVDAFFKLCTQVAAKRNQLLDHMLMIHAECAGSGEAK